jgi:penicillin-binding protein 2
MRVEASGARLSVLGLSVLVLMGALFTRLWFLTLADAPGLEQRVEARGLRTVPLLPMRGRIYDREGRVLADNVRSLTVVIDQNQLRDKLKRAQIFQVLAGAVNTPVSVLEARYNSEKYNRLLPLPVAENVSEEVAGFIMEQRANYPGVTVREDSVRRYRYAPLASHLIGYLGPILKEDAESYKAKGYALDEVVGLNGVEASYEAVLRGKPGYKKVEVDNQNRVIREIERVEPEPGADLQLTIDLKLQQYAEQMLITELSLRRTVAPSIVEKIDGTVVRIPENFKAPVGSLIVEDVNTAEIMAMASYPTYDNRWFNTGTDNLVLDALFGFDTVDGVQKPRFDGPLFNRSVSGQYQIGSTMKLFTAIAGMRWGKIPDPYAKYHDTGKWSFPDCPAGEPSGCTRRNAGGAVYGEVNLPEALAVSVDTYFYELGAQLWVKTPTGSDALQTELRNFGLGKRSGIKLPGEQAGLVPDAKVKAELAKKRVITKFEGSRYFTGDNVNLGIGQGLLGVTPLQLVNGYATFANRGTLRSPLIVRAIWEPSTVDSVAGRVDFEKMKIRESLTAADLGTVDLPETYRKPIIEGFTAVVNPVRVNGDKTTAYDTFLSYNHKDYPLWGKTGTAQTDKAFDEKDTSLFVGVGGPDLETPQFAIGAILEESGFGGRAAAPLVRCMFEALKEPRVLDEPKTSLPLNKTVVKPAAQFPGLATVENAYCLNIVFSETRNVID